MFDIMWPDRQWLGLYAPALVAPGLQNHITTAHYSLGLFATLSATRKRINMIIRITGREKAPFLQVNQANTQGKRK
jgi:hypothetical protein